MMIKLELDDDLAGVLSEYRGSLFIAKGYDASTEELVLTIIQDYLEDVLEPREKDDYPLIPYALLETP